jgi:hypothetical protein
LEWAALELAETKDQTSRIESDVTGLRAAMTDGGAKGEEIEREVAGLKAQFSNCCPIMKNDITNLDQKLAKLKDEMKGATLKAEPLVPPPAVMVVRPVPVPTPSAKPQLCQRPRHLDAVVRITSRLITIGVEVDDQIKCIAQLSRTPSARSGGSGISRRLI